MSYICNTTVQQTTSKFNSLQEKDYGSLLCLRVALNSFSLGWDQLGLALAVGWVLLNMPPSFI